MRENREFYINDQGTELHLKLEVPEALKEPHTLGIVVHGFTGDMEEPHIITATKALRDAGCASLRAELYGHGKSGGAFFDHTIDRWLENLRAVIAYARTLKEYDRLILCGHSQGGLLVMLEAAEIPDQIDALIPLSPAVMIPEESRNGILLGVQFSPDHLPEQILVEDGIPLGKAYLECAQAIDPYAVIGAYHGPVLIVHGADDLTVPLSVAERASKEYENVTLTVIEGEDHCFDFHPDQMAEAVRSFVEKL